MPTPLALIVGLGNPGAEYARTRHNAGEDFVREIAGSFNATLKAEPRFNGLTARLTLAGQDVRLLIPQTFMNRSGQAVGPMAGFFKLSPAQILVAYDELDLPPGEVRFKEGGGHGGHNGVRDIIAALGNQNAFYRLRIGIGHPGDKNEVADYVLRKPSPDHRTLIEECVARTLKAAPDLLAGEMTRATSTVHTHKPPRPKPPRPEGV